MTFFAGYETFGPTDKVVLRFQLHHALDKMAVADVVEGRLDVHRQCPRNVFPVPLWYK